MDLPQISPEQFLLLTACYMRQCQTLLFLALSTKSASTIAPSLPPKSKTSTMTWVRPAHLRPRHLHLRRHPRHLLCQDVPDLGLVGVALWGQPLLMCSQRLTVRPMGRQLPLRPGLMFGPAESTGHQLKVRHSYVLVRETVQRQLALTCLVQITCREPILIYIGYRGSRLRYLAARRLALLTLATL